MYHHISWPDAGTSATTCDLRPLPCWISITNFVSFAVLNMMELFELFIISFPNSRWTLWEAKQTRDIVSNKAGKQSIFSGALIKLAYWSWYLYIVEYHSLVSTIPYCSHVAFINSCLLADCDPTNSNICFPAVRCCLPVFCCERCTTYVYLFTKQSEGRGDRNEERWIVEIHF